MKTLRNYFLSALTLFVVCSWSCKEDDGPETISFKFEFSSFGGPVQGDTSCGQPPVFLVRQDGQGTDDLLGNFTFVAEFCNNLDTGEYFGIESSIGYFEAENGDHLNVIFIDGQIIPSNTEGYDLMFQDEFRIDGGTGRFEGATGSGMTDSFVVLAVGRTDHVWTGSIILK